MFASNNYRAEVKRGWPMDGSLDRDEPIYTNAGVVATLQCGDWVQKRADNTVGLALNAKTASAGMVVSGNADSASSAYTSKATVLWGNFIAEVTYSGSGSNPAVTSTTTSGSGTNPVAVGSFTPGTALTVLNGQLVPAQAGVMGTSFPDPIVGYVLDVVAASTSTVNTGSGPVSAAPTQACLVVKIN